MKSQGESAPHAGLWTSTGVFAKIYNAIYCSKKTQVCRGPRGSPVDDDAAPAPMEAWFQSVKQHSTTLVQQLLDEGQVEVNTRDQNGWSALHISVWNGFTDLVALLLERDADINLPGPGGSTPVALAAQKGHADIVTVLISADCDVRRTASLGVDKHDVTPLHLAAQNGHTAIVRQLIDAGAVVNAAMMCGTMKGVTPLHLAVQAEHLTVMDVLIAAGSDVQSSTQPNLETTC